MQNQANTTSQNEAENTMIPIGIIKPIITINRVIMVFNNLFLLAVVLVEILSRLITSKTSIGNVSIEIMISTKDTIITISLFIISLMFFTIFILRFKLTKVTNYLFHKS